MDTENLVFFYNLCAIANISGRLLFVCVFVCLSIRALLYNCKQSLQQRKENMAKKRRWRQRESKVMKHE